jgi:RNA polymerase sigma-70 factor (ECF subfamily)
MSPDDRDLIQRWRQGEPLAFEAVVRRWQEPVARLLGRLLGFADLAQDACQEVFLKVYNARERYRDNGAFSTWLYRIALNVARDASRKRRREPARLEAHEPVDRAGPAEALCQQRESAELVARAIEELPLPLREVLVLRHYEGIKFEQMARLTGTPASTLKSRFAVALTRLRSRLQELGCGPEEPSP